MTNKIHISKLDAAKRQLSLAIKMFFYDSDVVATHTLTCAAYQILKDLSAKQGIKSIQDKMLDVVKPEFKTLFNQRLREPANFFKHADREDPGAILEFSPEQTSIFLFDASLLYKEITGEIDPVIAGYTTWYYLKHPDTLQESELKDKFMLESKNFNLDNKGEFYRLLLESESQLFRL